jgi:hypothetical protein
MYIAVWRSLLAYRHTRGPVLIQGRLGAQDAFLARMIGPSKGTIQSLSAWYSSSTLQTGETWTQAVENVLSLTPIGGVVYGGIRNPVFVLVRLHPSYMSSIA